MRAERAAVPGGVGCMHTGLVATWVWLALATLITQMYLSLPKLA